MSEDMQARIEQLENELKVLRHQLIVSMRPYVLISFNVSNTPYGIVYVNSKERCEQYAQSLGLKVLNGGGLIPANEQPLGGRMLWGRIEYIAPDSNPDKWQYVQEWIAENKNATARVFPVIGGGAA